MNVIRWRLMKDRWAGAPAAALLMTIALAAPAAGGGARPAPEANDELAVARQGIDRMMDGDFDGAVAAFRRLQQSDPESPLGYVLEADADGWKIYLTRGNLIDPDVFEALSEAVTPYDADFERLDHLAIAKAEARLQVHQDEARSDLYEALAYGLQARLFALRSHALATARAGKKMRNLSLRALQLDPHLYDAELGIGIYNYFVDTLPTYVKMLRFLIELPGGSRELGLRELGEAAEKGELTRPEATFHLAKNLSRRTERQYARSLALFRQLAQEYPHNPLWRLLEGSLEIRLGQTQLGEADYRAAAAIAADMKPELWQALHEQAEDALARRHPQYRRD